MAALVFRSVSPVPGDPCVICRDVISPTDLTTGHADDRIRHVFHTLCIVRAEQKKCTRCPLCNHQFTLLPSPELCIAAAKSDEPVSLISYLKETGLLPPTPEALGRAVLGCMEIREFGDVLRLLLSDNASISSQALERALLLSLRTEFPLDTMEVLLGGNRSISMAVRGEAVLLSIKQLEAVALVRYLLSNNIQQVWDYETGRISLSAALEWRTPALSIEQRGQALVLAVGHPSQALALIRELVVDGPIDPRDLGRAVIAGTGHPSALPIIKKLLSINDISEQDRREALHKIRDLQRDDPNNRDLDSLWQLLGGKDPALFCTIL